MTANANRQRRRRPWTPDGRVVNIHQREYCVPATQVASLLATLSSRHDRLWPHERWPRMRLDPGLSPGGSGGHGPVRYRVERVHPTGVVFRFTGPTGFDGWHGFEVIDAGATTRLRHELRMRARGWARLSWPLFFRPLHDALLEDAFDKAARELGVPPGPARRPRRWARLLLRLATRWTTRKGRTRGDTPGSAR